MGNIIAIHGDTTAPTDSHTPGTPTPPTEIGSDNPSIPAHTPDGTAEPDVEIC